MATPSEIVDAAGAKPKRVKTTTADVEQQSLTDLIAWEKYLASKAARAASSSPLAGLTIGIAAPPSAVGRVKTNTNTI